MARAHHADADARGIGAAEAVHEAGTHRGEDAARGHRARVAAAAALVGQADHVGGALGDHRHVGRPGADVLGGDVAAAERLDRVAEVE